MMAASATATRMTLGKLLAGRVTLPAELDCELADMTSDSRQVRPGSLFCAVAGMSVHGASYIDDAIHNGAVAVLWEPQTGAEVAAVVSVRQHRQQKIPVVALAELSTQLGMLADRFYGEPSRRLYVTGITGTNGKTSCSQFLAQALHEDQPCGVIGTLGSGLYGELQASGHTTPDVISNHRQLAQMQAAGATEVVMEVSSHALDQQRVAGIRFACAVFTNLSHEHIDYHGDMQNYAAAKKRLFELPGLKTAVINADDALGRELLKTIDPRIAALSYGLEEAYLPDLLARNLRLDLQGMSFEVESRLAQGLISCGLLGRFNVSNLLAVLGVLLSKGMKFDEAQARLARLNTVAGRMQRFGGVAAPLVIVDYAHTPDALQHVLAALREHCQARLWCVFGCGGDRDRDKRPLMGAIAEQQADQVIITNDNPRHEDPQRIIMQIQAGMQAPQQAHVEPDRSAAIGWAIARAGAQDVVLVAGKGHEDYQQFGSEKRPFSDVLEVQRHLQLRT